VNGTARSGTVLNRTVLSATVLGATVLAGAVMDGAVVVGAILGRGVPSCSVSAWAAPDGTIPDGSVPDSTIPDGTVTDGTVARDAFPGGGADQAQQQVEEPPELGVVRSVVHNNSCTAQHCEWYSRRVTVAPYNSLDSSPPRLWRASRLAGSRAA
jgi:hypothetical protein